MGRTRASDHDLDQIAKRIGANKNVIREIDYLDILSLLRQNIVQDPRSIRDILHQCKVEEVFCNILSSYEGDSS